MNYYLMVGGTLTPVANPDTQTVPIAGYSVRVATAFMRHSPAVCATAGLYRELLMPGLPPYAAPFIDEVSGEPWAVRVATGTAEDLGVQIAAAQAAVIEQIYARAAECLDAASPHYSPLEIATFSAQADEARAWQAERLVVGPLMRRRLGETAPPQAVDELAARIIARQTLTDDYRAAVQSARTSHRAALAALASSTTTPAQVAAYDTSLGWPEPPADPFAP
jgi:hypothetical protein